MLIRCFLSPANEDLQAFSVYHTPIGYSQVQNALLCQKVRMMRSLVMSVIWQVSANAKPREGV